MKISKLFHWLYAILMLLPFAFFVPSVLYYAFNDNATMQSVEVPKIETISVDFNQQFSADTYVFPSVRLGLTSTQYGESVSVVGTNTNTTREQWFYSDVLSINQNHIYYLNSYFTGAEYSNMTSWVALTRSDNSRNYLTLPVRLSGYSSCRFYNQNEGITEDYDFTIQFMIYDLTQMFGSGNEPTISEFNQMFPNYYYPYIESELMQITYDTGETEQLVSNTDIVNYAWVSIWDLPLFNWCKVSFVSVPFTYITGLFGLAASNSFNYVFTYFASMSIIWLVFDVIMYVPLLVHRWLDKGIVE